MKNLFKKIIAPFLIALQIITPSFVSASAIISPQAQQLNYQPKTLAMIGDSITMYNYVGGLQFTGVWSSAISISAGGSGYIIGDTINLGNGLTVQVVTLSGSAVATANIINYGAIASAPGNPVAQVSTSGSGTGATFTVTWTSFGTSFPPAAAQVTPGVAITNAVWSIDYVESECPGGVGTLNFNGSTLIWTPNGLGAGAAVDGTKNGKIYVPGPSASQGIWLNWFSQRGTYTSTILSLDVQANGFQIFNYNAKGFGVNALAQSGQQIVFAKNTSVLGGRDSIYGLGGASSTDLVNAQYQWQQILDNADIVIEESGTNDISTSTAPATIIANRTKIWDAVTKKNKILIISSIPPRALGAAFTATQTAQKSQVDQAAYAYSKTHARTYFLEMTPYIEDASTGNYVQSPVSYSTDGVHPTGAGAYYGAKPLAQILSLIKTGSLYQTSYGDLYNSTNNPNGNLLPSLGMGVWNGTGGTIGTGCSGTLGSGWQCARSTGSNMTATLSQVARTDGITGNWQQVVLGGATTNEITTIQLAGATSTTFLGAGNTLEALLEVKVVTSSGLNVLTNQMAPNDGVSARASQGFNSIGVDPNPGQTLWIKIHGWTVPTGATGFYPGILLGTSSGGSATIQLGRVIFKKAQ